VLTSGFCRIEESVREDMDIIKKDPFMPKDLEVIGFVYDSFTGKTYEVV
jgi:carbonic anhydrase